jgi:hypothetical protein
MSSDSSVTPPVSARALASRMNGARSRGPRTVAGRVRSARNALKHGLCAHRFLVLPEEDAKAFKALETALLAELAPVGTLEGVFAQRVVSAAWRLMRADRMEAEVFVRRRLGDGGLGLALIRDGNGTRSIETLMRYRAAAETQLQRALATLQALQAKAAAEPPARRRRGPRPGTVRNEPTKAREINRLAEKVASNRRPCADAAPASNSKPARDMSASPPASQTRTPCDAYPDLQTIARIVASIAAGRNQTNPRHPSKPTTCI